MAVILLAAPGARATLIGDNVTCDIIPSSLWACDAATATVVDPGKEFTLLLTGNARFDVDIGASSIDLLHVGTNGLQLGAGEVVTFGDLDWVGLNGMIVGFSLTTGGTTGLVASDVTFTDHSLSIDLDNGAQYDPDAFINIDLDVVHTPIPEPATMGLFLAGLAAFGTRRRA